MSFNIVSRNRYGFLPGAPSFAFFAKGGFATPALLQNPLTVDHRDDQHLIFSQSVDNPITVDDKFAYVLVVKFRYFAACLRKARQNPRLIHNVLKNIPA
jgi:hypothetical protein